MKRTLFFKSFLVTACMFAMCFIVSGVSMIAMGRVFLVRERQESLHTSASEIKRLVEATYEQEELSSFTLRMSLTVISNCTGEHIFLCDESGLVVSSSDGTRVSPYVGRTMDADVISQLRADGQYEAITTLGGFYEGNHYVVAEPVSAKNGQTVGYVFATHEADDILTMWKGFLATFTLISAGVLTLAVCFQYFYSRRMARPLHEMAEAANRFARGDYSARISPYEDDDEIGTLTEAFNAMAEGLEQNESRRQEFIANVSHELRTPMTAISGFAEGLLDGTIPQSEQRRYLETIYSETNRLSRLVRSMLDMSRLRDGGLSGREERFDLGEMVVRTLLNFEDRVGKKRLEMTLNMPEDKIFVLGDMDALTRVVYNLVDNAVKFADEGTELAVNIWKENGKAYTCIQNTGQTIPRSELPLIFDRFHKSDRSRSRDRDGVGLGLYMVKEIIAAHGQEILVTSEDGVTAFTFTLALADGS